LVPWAFGLGIYISLRQKPTRVEALAVSWAIGWTSINVVTILANQFAKIPANDGFFGTVSAVFAASATLLLVRGRRRLVVLIEGPVIPQGLREGVGLGVLSLFVGFLAFVFYQAMRTPAASTDALVYHMRIPVLAWRTGYIPMNPGIGWLELANTFPNLVETQQLWIYLGAQEANEVLVRPIMPIYTSLILLLVFSDARRWFGLSSAAMATASLFALNEFASLTTVLWAELPVAFYSYLAVRTIADEQGIRSRAVAGAYAGMASLVKYNGLLLLLAVALAAALLALRSGNHGAAGLARKRWILSLFEFGLVIGTGLLVCSPLLLRNLYFFGNPIYPFIWGGANTEQVAYYFADYTPNDYLRFRLHEMIILLGSVLSFAFALGLLRLRSWSRLEGVFAMTSLIYLGQFAYATLAGSYVRYLAPTIPVLAAFGGRQLCWWLLETDRRHWTTGGVLLLGLAAGVVALLRISDVKPAYLTQYVETFVAVGACLLLLAISIRWMRSDGTRRVAAAIIAGVLLSPGVLAVAAERFPPREASLDLELVPRDAQAFLLSHFGDDWRTWEWINANLPVDAILLTFESRLFYIDRNILFGSDHALLPTYSMSLLDAVSFVRGLGARYILDSPWSHIPEVNRIFWQRSVIFQNLNNRSFFQPIHTEGQVIVYSI